MKTMTSNNNNKDLTTSDRDTVPIRTPHLNSRRVQKRLGYDKGPLDATERLKGTYMSIKSYRIINYGPRVFYVFFLFPFSLFPTTGKFMGLSVKSVSTFLNVVTPVYVVITRGEETDMETLVFDFSH